MAEPRPSVALASPPGAARARRAVCRSSASADRERQTLLVSLFVAVTLVLGSNEFPTRHAVGGPAPASREHAKPFVRLATFNIHGGKGEDGSRDLARIGELLDGCDFVGLNEVHGESWLGDEDQAARLAGQLGMNAVFAPTEHRWGTPTFGNAVLSAVGIERWERVPLDPKCPKSGRNMVLVDAPFGEGELHVLLTHISRASDATRSAQLACVIDRFLQMPTPAVLIGDLNTSASDPQMQKLLATEGVGDPLAEARSQTLPTSIDWILTRGVEASGGAIVMNKASDHPLVWIDVAVGGNRKQGTGDRK